MDGFGFWAGVASGIMFSVLTWVVLTVGSIVCTAVKIEQFRDEAHE